jgi:hypothetical protein
MDTIHQLSKPQQTSKKVLGSIKHARLGALGGGGEDINDTSQLQSSCQARSQLLFLLLASSFWRATPMYHSC